MRACQVFSMLPPDDGPSRRRSPSIRSFLVLLCTTVIVEVAHAATPFRVTETGFGAWTVEFTPSVPALSTKIINGERYILFEGPGCVPGRAGQPQLPQEALTFGIPSGTSLKVEVIDPVYTVSTGQRVAPAPSHEITSEGEAVDVYSLDRREYAVNRFLPAELATVTGPSTFRHQRLSTVILHPYQYNAATGELRTLVNTKLRVTLRDAPPPQGVPAPPDPAFEPLYKSLLCNYEQARRWRLTATHSGVHDSTRNWFDLNRPYIRIKVAQNGWYRFTAAELAASSAEWGAVDPGSLKVYANGTEIPIVVRPDTAVEFFGHRNRGDSTYFDACTDTSAYWLTWGGPPGLRFTPSPQPSGAAITTRSALSTVHFEQNTGYFTGTTQLDVIQTGDVPGEGWYWERIFPGSTFAAGFALADVDTAAHQIAFRVRLVSMTPDSPAVDHHARIWINDSLAGDALFEGRTAIVFTDSFPSAWLRADSNLIRIGSIQTPTIPNLFYLDWLEVDVRKVLHATRDELDFAADPAPGPMEFQVTGFSGSAVEVRDMGGKREIIGCTVSGDSAAGYTLVFRDTVSVRREYHIGPAGSGLRAAPLESKRFRNLRDIPSGADCLILTHKIFRSAAERLTAHRISAGLRSLAVDVQDVYDEFSFGVVKPAAIRSFLRYAFDHWTAPAPGWVLLLGDASWDPHRYLGSSVKQDFVPSHGVPAGDNWFVEGDSSILPLMAIGRLPVEDSVQALRTVDKIVVSEAAATGLWNKNFLMITGGTSEGEQETYNSRSETTIATYLSTPPIGGTAFRAYKSTEAVIDGEHRERIRNLFRGGLSFVNFLGHSGGRTWSVDIGDPATLENTDGHLPFVSSVSCNIAAFAEPSGNVLAEDLVMADHRGALAVWASSSLGYAASGTQLVNLLLAAVRDDSLRDLGRLTTLARLRLFQSDPTDPITRAMVQLNPLIGDPLSRLAIPLQPDFAIEQGGIRVIPRNSPGSGMTASVTADLLNYGLVPPDSVGVQVTDQFNGRTTELLRGRIRPILQQDSLDVPWAPEPGLHTLRCVIDPDNLLAESNEGNNAVTLEPEIFSRNLAVLRPLRAQVVLPGPVRLVATRAGDSVPQDQHFLFELDTLSSFATPSHPSSGPVSPGPVTGEWLTPVLDSGRVFFWRARSESAGISSDWTKGSFSTSAAAPRGLPVQLRHHTPALLGQDTLLGAAVTDSGITIAPQPALALFVRSLGSRANPATNYYTEVRVNGITFQGRWQEIGSGFLIARIDPGSGSYEFRGFDVPADIAEAESMSVFLEDTPVGSYLAAAAILDARTNVTSRLVAALQSIGSTQISGVIPGMSWGILSLKGSPSTALEAVSTDSVVLTTSIPRTYASGAATLLGDFFPAATRWDSLHWVSSVIPGRTATTVSFLASRRGGGVDTLLVIPYAGSDVSLSTLNPLVSTAVYTGVRPVFSLRSHDVLATPVLREWTLDLFPPAEIAVAAGGITDTLIPRGEVYEFPVQLYNIGDATATQIPLTSTFVDAANLRHPFGSMIVDTISPGGVWTTSFPLPTGNLPQRIRLIAAAWETTQGADLIEGNNIVSTSVSIAGVRGGEVRLLADGRPIIEGEYIVPEPALTLALPEPGDPPVTATGVSLKIDGAAVSDQQPGPGDHLFRPVLQDGMHTIEVQVYRDGLGVRDTVVQRIAVHVERKTRLLQVFPYPSPFDRETGFTFTLTGSDSPEEVVIRVFTVAGRKIQEILVPGALVGVGFNRVRWDGRDAEGDEVANGLYFFQLAVRGLDGTSETVTGKLVKVR
jgi:hypothetical protein